MSVSWLFQFGSVRDGKDNRNRRALACRALDCQLTSHPFGPFSHTLQAEALVLPLRIEAASIVAQVQANFTAVEHEQHLELAGLSVSEDIGQYLLPDAKKIGFPFRRQFPSFALQGEFRVHGRAPGHFLDQIFQRLAQRFLLQRLWAERLHRAPCFAQALAGEFSSSIQMAGGFHRLIPGHGLLNCFQLNDHAGESLRERVMNVASHSITLGHHRRLTTLGGKTGQLDGQSCLMGESTGQLDLLLSETTLLSETDADESRNTSGDEHRHKQNRVDAHLPQMRLETYHGGSQMSVVQNVVPGCIGGESDTHPDYGLINVFDDGVKTRVQNFPPHRMILCQHCEPCGRMDSATSSLKAAILDQGEKFQPITVRLSIPDAGTVRI